MKRKVNRVGQNTLTVSLPSKWVKQQGIKYGDELDVEDFDSHIIISRNYKRIERTVTLDISGFKLRPVKMVTNIAYKLGYDVINLKFESPETLELIKYTLGINLGMEIIEQKEKSCIIKNISRDFKEEFEGIVRRDFLNTKEMLRIASEMIKNNRYADLKSLESFALINDMNTTAAQKIINVYYEKSEKTANFYTLFWQIEKVVDEFKYLFNYLSTSNNVKLSNDAKSLFSVVQNFQERFHTLYYKFDIRQINIFCTEVMNFSKDCIQKMQKSKKDETIFIMYLINAAEKINEAMPPLFALNIEKYKVENE